jgi:hypothetical protein
MKKISPGLILLLLLGAFVLRMVYGMTLFSNEDTLQVYLIGLKWYTTGLFPFWGPDVVYTQSQIPGALQGILAGSAFFIKAIPESPLIFINLLSIISLCYFGWYLSKRIPSTPKWFLYGWLLSAPWTLYYSTKAENPSYVMPAAILFFIAIWELFPFYHQRIMQRKWAFFWLGFSLSWVFQLHLSWVLMMPYIGLAFYFQWKEKAGLGIAALFFLLGAVLTGSTLAPTLYLYGSSASSGSEQNIALNLNNLLELFSVAGKFLAFAAGEVGRFIGGGTPEQLRFLKSYPWAAPFTIIFTLLGLVQVGYLAYSFIRNKPQAEWKMVKIFTLGSIVLVWLSYLFATQPPKGHAFYLMFPVAMWFSFYCYTNLFKIKYLPTVFGAFLLSGMVFHTALGMRNAANTGFSHKREMIRQSLEHMDYTRLSIRRESALEVSKWEDIWKVTAGKDSIAFYNGFEYPNPYFKPQNILGNNARSSTFCCKMDTIQPFGLNFREKIAPEKAPQHCSLSAFLKGNFGGDIQAILELNSKEKNVLRQSLPITREQFVNDTWQPIALQYSIPDSTQAWDEAKCYIWLSSKSGGVLLLDDVSLIFSSASAQ